MTVFSSDYLVKPTNDVIFEGMDDTTRRIGLIIRHNLQNANTTAFKGVFTNSILVDPTEKNLIRDESRGVNVPTPGYPLNMALTEKNAFFLIEGPEGKPVRTRDGEFHVNAEGRIVNTQDQELVVLDKTAEENVRELLKKTDEVTINQMGEIRVKGKYYGKVAVDYQDRMPGQYSKVLQGFLESSNVDADDNVMKVVQLKRHYESLQNMMAMNLSVEKSLVETYGRNV